MFSCTERDRRVAKHNARRESFNSGSFSTFGVEPIFASIRTIPIEQGRFINDADETEARRICVMGQNVRKQLFADRGGVVGSHIDINGMQFLVTGLMANMNQNSDYNGLDEDKTIMLETVGLVAGLLPAIKASRLDPIEGLRYE